MGVQFGAPRKVSLPPIRPSWDPVEPRWALAEAPGDLRLQRTLGLPVRLNPRPALVQAASWPEADLSYIFVCSHICSDPSDHGLRRLSGLQEILVSKPWLAYLNPSPGPGPC